MSERTKRIAKKLGATVVARFPETGGGAFGAARLAALRARLQPRVGVRPGRPTDSSWNLRRKIPLSAGTLRKLEQIAAEVSDSDRKVSPMQVAAQLLEQGVQATKRARRRLGTATG